MDLLAEREGFRSDAAAHDVSAAQAARGHATRRAARATARATSRVPATVSAVSQGSTASIRFRWGFIRMRLGASDGVGNDGKKAVRAHSVGDRWHPRLRRRQPRLLEFIFLQKPRCPYYSIS